MFHLLNKIPRRSDIFVWYFIVYLYSYAKYNYLTVPILKSINSLNNRCVWPAISTSYQLESVAF